MSAHGLLAADDGGGGDEGDTSSNGGGEGEGGGGDADGEGAPRVPQSTQSVPTAQIEYSEPAPPSSQSLSET